MAHVRTAIRTAIASRLTGLATTGARCYPSRIHPLADANLPGLRVYLDGEEVEQMTIHPAPVLRRIPELVVECCAKAVSGLDSTLDTMLAEVETALATAPDATYGGLIKAHPALSGVEMDMDDGLEKPVGLLRARFRITYFTTATNPAAAI